MSKQNDGLIYKLTWMLNDEKSSYKRTILQETIDELSGPGWHDAKKESPKENGEYYCYVSWPDGDGDLMTTFYNNGEWTIMRSDPVPDVVYWTEILPLPKEDDASGEVQEVHLDGGEC